MVHSSLAASLFKKNYILLLNKMCSKQSTQPRKESIPYPKGADNLKIDTRETQRKGKEGAGKDTVVEEDVVI